jgi:hypothetical protein
MEESLFFCLTHSVGRTAVSLLDCFQVSPIFRVDVTESLTSPTPAKKPKKKIQRFSSSRNTMSSSGFGQWYENQQAAENGNASASSSWLGSSADMLPLFNTDSMPSVSFSSMKASMEAQMPKQIMGMGYQQRFKASGFVCLLQI